MQLLRKDKILAKRLGISLLLLLLARIVFLIVNWKAFYGLAFTDIFASIWMDMITIALFFLPFGVFSLLPNPWGHTRVYQWFLKVLFHLTNGVMLALNLIDVEYFKYTAKRSTSDLFSMILIGNDFGNMASSFLLDFWWLFLIFIALIVLSNFLYNKTLPVEKIQSNYVFRILNLLILTFAFVIVGRGGFGVRPVNTLLASQLTKPQNTSLVMNTPFSVLRTIGKPALVEKKYFETDSDAIYFPLHKGSTKHQLREELNVMVIILESFGDEWLGKKRGTPFTPFLDSLLGKSLYFENGFANGKKSIEAVPTIFAGIPSLLDNPYITSGYGSNNMVALPHILKKHGYSSAFFHGASNGSMNFDLFSAALGFDDYFGRKEYNNEDHTDEAWGVLDEYFLPWTAQTISKELQEPFIAGLFTLSSHHPFFVPEKYRSILPKGEHPMAQSVAYADMSLRLFFETAKQQDWYENTIFVLAADHTPMADEPEYGQRTEMYRIPIAIFDPQQQLKPHQEKRIFNQMDIMPTVLDVVGISDDVYSFGNSYFSNKKPFSVNYIDNSYAFYEDDFMLFFVDDESRGLYDFKHDLFMEHDSLSALPEKATEMEKRLKGFIQRYNRDLIYNSMDVDSLK